MLNIFHRISTLREKCPNTEFFLVSIFLYSDWILTFTVSKYLLNNKIHNMYFLKLCFHYICFSHFYINQYINDNVKSSMIYWLILKKITIFQLFDFYLGFWNQISFDLENINGPKWHVFFCSEMMFSVIYVFMTLKKCVFMMKQK